MGFEMFSDVLTMTSGVHRCFYRGSQMFSICGSGWLIRYAIFGYFWVFSGYFIGSKTIIKWKYGLWLCKRTWWFLSFWWSKSHLKWEQRLWWSKRIWWSTSLRWSKKSFNWNYGLLYSKSQRWYFLLRWTGNLYDLYVLSMTKSITKSKTKSKTRSKTQSKTKSKTNTFLAI